MLYTAAFDPTQISGVGTLTLKTSGKSDLVIDLSTITGITVSLGLSSIFFHYTRLVGQFLYIHAEDETAVHRRTDLSITPWETALTNAAQTAASGASWTSPTSLVFTMDITTGLVTASYTTTFQMVWSTATGRALCGFDADKSGASSYAGTVVPTYVIKPTMSATSVDQSLQGLNYEPDGIATDVTADDGSGYSMSRYVAPLYRDFKQELEVKAKVIREAAASTHPWTFQHLKQHCRKGFPFIVNNGFGANTSECFSLRGQGMSWRPDRRGIGNDVLFDVNFLTRVEGLIDLSS